MDDDDDRHRYDGDDGQRSDEQHGVGPSTARHARNAPRGAVAEATALAVPLVQHSLHPLAVVTERSVAVGPE